PVVEINGFTLFHCKRKKTVGKLSNFLSLSTVWGTQIWVLFCILLNDVKSQKEFLTCVLR
ncbi:hypothetical protein AO843_22080, partial [Lysinibacillus sp. ZYM-1]